MVENYNSPQKSFDGKLSFPSIFLNFPFDSFRMTGKESVDFLQRITSNDFSSFKKGKIQKTLLISEKGRVIDAVWVLHEEDSMLLLCSQGMAEENISWLNKFIIMEDIVLSDCSSENKINLYFHNEGDADYFGILCSFLFEQKVPTGVTIFHENEFEKFRIFNGIPKSKKELTIDYNPLELNLWNWISFTKGCYIGQEVIARLETYQKIQRTLCFISSTQPIQEGEILINAVNEEVGKITSVQTIKNNESIGLAIIKTKLFDAQSVLKTKTANTEIKIEKLFTKETDGRN